jgi:hypothetical protein
MDEIQLNGGVANAGAVTRVGAHVLRPSNACTASIHRFLAALRAQGFDGVPEPIGIDTDGRERLAYVEGDVPVPPFPAWAQTDDVLASVADLMRRFHEASRSFDPTGMTWSTEAPDPAGGSIVCHGDVCLENVVFRDGVAVALLDFDFAAPGRTIYDLANMARMCVPVDDDFDAARLGWAPADRPRRLRLIADTYGLDRTERGLLFETLGALIQQGGEWVRRKVEAGEPGFVRMWEEMGGMARFDRRREWWAEQQGRFERALAD